MSGLTPSITLAQLRYIVAVDRHRHFARAASACNVSQPTLSMAIMKVEEELNAPLFDRSRKPVVPTDLGLKVIAQARVILREGERMAGIISEANDEIAGELVIGIIPTLAPYILPLVTRPFAEAYPKVLLSIHEMTTGVILEELAAERIDAALLATAESGPGFTERPLFSERFVAYVSPDHRLADQREIRTEDLDLEDLWLLSEGHCFRDQVLDLCGGDSQTCGPRRSVIFESGNLETIRHMVESTGGMTLLPEIATDYLSADQNATYVRPFLSPSPTRTVRILSGRADLKRRLIDAWTERLLANIPVYSEQ